MSKFQLEKQYVQTMYRPLSYQTNCLNSKILYTFVLRTKIGHYREKRYQFSVLDTKVYKICKLYRFESKE